VLTANVTAGHTPGCTTWTATINENNKGLNVLFLCSVSSPGYDLVTDKKYPAIEADYLASFAWLKKQKVDIFLGAHAGFFDLADKTAHLRKGRIAQSFHRSARLQRIYRRRRKGFSRKTENSKGRLKVILI